MSTQAGLTVILSALAPFTAFWYVSGSAYEPAILFNGLMFAVASFSAQWMLRRELRAADPRAIPGIAGCCGPGSSSTCSSASRWAGCSGRSSATRDAPPSSSGRGAWTNAYEVVFQMIWDVLSGAARRVNDALDLRPSRLERARCPDAECLTAHSMTNGRLLSNSVRSSGGNVSRRTRTV